MPTKSGKLGIACIGSGEIASAYLPAIKAQEDAEPVWTQDISEFQARRMGEHNNVPWTTDLKEVLSDPCVDAVIVAVPHGLHAELTIKAAKAGKHVMCDKPISTNREDALAMINACRDAGVLLGVNLASRYLPFSGIVKDLIARGVIGNVVLTKVGIYANKPASYWVTGWMEGGNTSWRASKKMAGGGIGIMNMTHEIDRMMYCLDMGIKHVKGECDTYLAKVEVEDTLAATWRWDNGAIGSLVAGSNCWGNGQEPTRVFGTHGQLELWEPIRVYTIREDTEFKPKEWHTIEVPKMENNYIPYIKDFCKAIREGGPAPITGEDGFRVLDVILGIYESSETGRTIHMRKDI